MFSSPLILFSWAQFTQHAEHLVEGSVLITGAYCCKWECTQIPSNINGITSKFAKLWKSVNGFCVNWPLDIVIPSVKTCLLVVPSVSLSWKLIASLSLLSVLHPSTKQCPWWTGFCEVYDDRMLHWLRPERQSGQLGGGCWVEQTFLWCRTCQLLSPTTSALLWEDGREDFLQQTVDRQECQV